MTTDYDAELRKINSDEEKYKEAIAARKTMLINDLLEEFGLLRGTPYEYALCQIHRSLEVAKQLSPNVSEDELKMLRAKAKAYDTMSAAPSVFVDPLSFKDATETFFDVNGDREAHEMTASNNRVYPEEIKLVEFVSYVDLLTDKD